MKVLIKDKGLELIINNDSNFSKRNESEYEVKTLYLDKNGQEIPYKQILPSLVGLQWYKVKDDYNKERFNQIQKHRWSTPNLSTSVATIYRKGKFEQIEVKRILLKTTENYRYYIKDYNVSKEHYEAIWEKWKSMKPKKPKIDLEV